MNQPSFGGRRRSVTALLILLGALATPASAGATTGDTPDPGPGDPPPVCAELDPTPDCPAPEPEPEPEPEPIDGQPAVPPQSTVPLPPPPPSSESAPRPPRLWTPSRSTASRPDRRTGRLTLARVTCWQGPCTITAPRQTTVRIGGKRFVAQVTGARRTVTGQTSVLRLQLTRAALRQLDRATTGTSVEVPIEIRSPAHTVDQTVVLSLR